MMSIAHMIAFPALLVPQLRNQNDTLYFNDEDGSWYTSVYSLSSPFGSVMAGIIMDRYGRRIALATPLIPCIVSWIATASAKTHLVLFIGRIALGVIGGFGPTICQVISSISLQKKVHIFMNDFFSLFFFRFIWPKVLTRNSVALQ